MGSQQILKCVQSDFVLLDVRVHKHHALYTVVDAMPDKVVLKQQLFSKDEAEISIAE